MAIRMFDITFYLVNTLVNAIFIWYVLHISARVVPQSARGKIFFIILGLWTLAIASRDFIPLRIDISTSAVFFAFLVLAQLPVFILGMRLRLSSAILLSIAYALMCVGINTTLYMLAIVAALTLY